MDDSAKNSKKTAKNPVDGNEIFNFISISEFEKKLCGDG